MTREAIVHWGQRIELGLLLVLCFFLPIYEAPKNLAWVGYVFVWLAFRIPTRRLGGPWDTWDTLIALWIASGYVVAAFAGLHANEWRGAGDLLRYGSILWLVKRSGYSAKVIRLILGTLVASVVVGLAHGYWRLYSGAGKSGYLQLHSVGHVNHTAIYIAIMLGVAISWIFARWKSWSNGTRAVAAAIGLLLLVSLVVTQSRGAIGVGLLIIPVLGTFWWRRSRAPLAFSVALVLVVIAFAGVFRPEFVQKQIRNETKHNVLSFRDGIWRMALVAWERFPVFGVGMDNYSLITHEKVKAWREAEKKPFNPDEYVQFPHAHSLYLNTLAERGVLGAGILFAVLGSWAVFLARRRPGAADRDLDWLLWGAASAAWLVTVMVGLVNTSLHHEHGILAVVLLGLWLSRQTPRVS